MDIYTFITELAKALAWPLTTVFALVVFRTHLLSLIPFMKKLKFKQFELEFSEQIRELKSKVKFNARMVSQSKAQDLISLSTRNAIFEAWAELERKAINSVSLTDVNASGIFLDDCIELGNYLHKCDFLDKEQLSIYHNLFRIRNKLINQENAQIARKDAEDYIAIAENLAQQIS